MFRQIRDIKVRHHPLSACVGRAREREKMRGEARGGEESSKGREVGSEYFQLICLFRARVKSAA